MRTFQIYRERLHSVDPRLGRHILHDERSRLFEFDTRELTLTSTSHARRIPVLDQGQLGSCVGNAAIGCLGTDPYYDTVAYDVNAGTSLPPELRRRPHANYSSRFSGTNTYYSLDEDGAVQLYSDATKADDYPGEYPPEDTGSDGLTVAKVLTKAGEIAGYRHTFSLDAALKALTVTPFITGVNWYEDMFHPDADGRVHPTGTLVGGHEFVADQLDVENERVWFTNSWGTAWGQSGRFYMTWADYGTLLNQRGDVTIFVSNDRPTPTPADPDTTLAAIAHHWVTEHHIGENAKVARALKTWLAAKNL